MISIGPIHLANNVALAPMSGITDAPFRRVVAEQGAGLVVSEMVASRELVAQRGDVVLRATNDGGVFPYIVQLAGCEAHWMAEGAKIAVDGGADIIDINMGCPSRQVTGTLTGSALMRDLDHALKLIEATVAAVAVPVTLKMRLGWDHDSLNAAELAMRAEAAGVQLITVHGRTRCQFYKGTADWCAVAHVKQSIKLPLLVNGDILTLEDAQNALLQSGADGVMIGRGAEGQPWLPGAIARALQDGAALTLPSLDECGQIARAHYLKTVRHYRDGHALGAEFGQALGIKMARKHLAAYVTHAANSFDEAKRKRVKSAICRSTDINYVLDLLEAVFKDDESADIITAA